MPPTPTDEPGAIIYYRPTETPAPTWRNVPPHPHKTHDQLAHQVRQSAILAATAATIA